MTKPKLEAQAGLGVNIYFLMCTDNEILFKPNARILNLVLESHRQRNDVQQVDKYLQLISKQGYFPKSSEEILEMLNH